MISQFFVFASRAELRFCQFFQKLSAVSLSEIYFDNYKDESFFNTYPGPRVNFNSYPDGPGFCQPFGSFSS